MRDRRALEISGADAEEIHVQAVVSSYDTLPAALDDWDPFCHFNRIPIEIGSGATTRHEPMVLMDLKRGQQKLSV